MARGWCSLMICRPPRVPPGEFNRLYTTSDQAIRASIDSLPAKAPDRERSPREIAQEILQRRLGGGPRGWPPSGSPTGRPGAGVGKALPRTQLLTRPRPAGVLSLLGSGRAPGAGIGRPARHGAAPLGVILDTGGAEPSAMAFLVGLRPLRKDELGFRGCGGLAGQCMPPVEAADA